MLSRRLTAAAVTASSASAPTLSAPPPTPEPAIPGGARLSAEQKLHLVLNGFVIVRNAVPKAVVERCRERMYRDDPRTKPADGPGAQNLIDVYLALLAASKFSR